MVEVSVKVDITQELEEKFKIVLTKFAKEFANKLELARAKEIVSKSKFTEKDAEELSEKVKKSMHESLKKEDLI